ncbi:glycosyltransferase family 4 protein [candidate division KSB1 bacterium]|nr:glycosyltransferase family 4 protein [candidate division KSB1 bacterium]
MAEKRKIAMVNKYHFVKGGSERYYFELTKILESKGHKVMPFAMKAPENVPSEYSQYFVDHIEFNQASVVKKLMMAPKAIGRIIYSLHAKRNFEKFINAAKPDIAHLHMIDHQISPSILDVLKKYDIPVIQTVHQYKMVCPNYLLYIPHKNEICERCIKGSILSPLVTKCHKNSLFASSILVAETWVHRMLKIYDTIDLFHAPSTFMQNKLIAGGIPAEKVTHHFYSINLDDFSFSGESDDYFVYIGRLSKEKGILTLLKAMTGIKKSRLLLIGDGPQRLELEAFATQQKLENVQFAGNKSRQEVRDLVAKAKFIVVPSEWYDNSPLVIYEAFAIGKPVLGAALGGISELVENRKMGLTFQAGDVDQLRINIEYMLGHESELKQWGKNARARAEQEFHPEKHYQWIDQVYSNLLN